MAFWKRELDASIPVWLPYDGSQNIGVAGRVKANLPVTTGELESIGRRVGATLHMVVLGAVQVLLHRYAGQEDIRIAVPVANRTTDDVQSTVGCFVNTIVLRSAVSSERTFLDHLEQVKCSAAAAYEHQDTPLDAVVAALHPDRGAGNPLFEVMVLVERDGLSVDVGPDIETQVKELENGVAKFDLTLTVRFKGRKVEAEVEYDEGRFRRTTIEGMLETLGELAKSIVREPDEQNGALRLLSARSEDEIARWEAAGPVTAERGAHEYFREQAQRTPDAIAVESGARTLTYRELDDWSNRVARGLARRGIGRESRVAIRLRRTEELVVAMLGVAKTGATYVPIDPEYPAERQHLIEKSACSASKGRRASEPPERRIAIDLRALRVSDRGLDNEAA